MALLLAWLNIGALVLLSFTCLVLLLDARGQRVALRAAQQTITALMARLSAVESASRARPSPALPLPAAPRAQPVILVRTARTSLGATRVHVPPPPGLDGQIERLWQAKITAARATGQKPAHCREGRCFHEGQSIAACECQCAECTLVVGLLVDARAEILSRSRDKG
jgi:hypothetical protein